jgi:tRNA pseudouridine38-40 synthase
LRNLRLLIEYDGGAYAGWQRQASDPTVQAAIEDALATLLRHPVTITGAGRTDSGVHARGQVANFLTPSEMDPRRVAAGLNGLLPDDIAILGCSEAPASFHARFDATGRRYSYTISALPAALDRRRVWQVSWPLDAGLLRDAASAITGSRDFTSFCRAGSEARHHVCAVREASWTQSGPLLRFGITADRFLHGMVRALVGTMVDVARGHTSPGEFAAMLESRDRREAGPAAPPHGLVLEEVLY